MLFFFKMVIIGAILGGVLEIIRGLINAIVKDDETAKTLNKYVTAIGWLVLIYIAIFQGALQLIINKNNTQNFKFQPYDSRTYNRINILRQQATELYNRGLQYVLRGFKAHNDDGVIIACNPTPEQVASYVGTTDYSSYWLEVARPLDGKIKVKKVSLQGWPQNSIMLFYINKAIEEQNRMFHVKQSKQWKEKIHYEI